MALESQNIKTNIYVHFWCNEYGLGQGIFEALVGMNVKCGRHIIPITPLDVSRLRLSVNEKDLLRRAIRQYTVCQKGADDVINDRLLKHCEQQRINNGKFTHYLALSGIKQLLNACLGALYHKLGGREGGKTDVAPCKTVDN